MIKVNMRQVFTNDDFVRGWNKVSNKNKISKQDQDLIEWAILSRDMEGFEKLCDKYALNDYDRNALAGAVGGAMLFKYGKI